MSNQSPDEAAEPARPQGTDLSAHRKVLVIAAHPDDPEFMAGGTVAALVDGGAEVHYVICTDGSQGGEDPGQPDEELVATRQCEQRAAAEVLGVAGVDFIGLKDGHLIVNLDFRRELTRVIRRHRPDLVITHSPQRMLNVAIGASHPDHQAVGEATLCAVYPDARNPRAFRELLAEGLEAHVVKEVWVATASDPDHFVDCTGSFDRKLEAIRSHASQVAKPGRDPWDFEKFLRERMEKIGQQAGVKYAEGFRRLITG